MQRLQDRESQRKTDLGADVTGVSPVPVHMLPREPSPGADVGGVSPVPAQMWEG